MPEARGLTVGAYFALNGCLTAWHLCGRGDRRASLRMRACV